MRAHFVILFLIILVSGCVNPFGGLSSSGGPGVVINSFSFSPSNLKSNQLTKLSLSIENKGDYSIDDDSGVVYLFNLPDDWEITDKSDSTAKTEQFSLLAPQAQGTKRYSIGNAGFEWILRAPKNLPKGEIFSYTAQARICYPYKTKIWGRLEVVSEDAWLRDPPSEHTIAAQQTNGPLKVEFLSKQPLMVETDVRIKARITNIGDGVVTANDCSVFESGADDEDIAINNLNRITLGDTDCALSDDLYLKKGQTMETYITCTPPLLGTNPITTSDFTMELTYNYYSDRKASVSVTGTSEDATGGMVGGGTGAGTITLTDMATKLCDANKQKFGDIAMGICRPESEANAFDYPVGNTFGFQMLVEALGSNDFGTDAKKILGTEPTTAIDLEAFKQVIGGEEKYKVALIKDLKLHDARMGDFSDADMTTKSKEDKILDKNGLLDWTISQLDSATFSKQYDAKMLDADTDGDGLPDWFEEKHASYVISATSKDTNKNGLLDPSEIYVDDKTYLKLYAEEKGNHVSSFGIADYICKNYAIGQKVGSEITITERPCKNMDAISKIKLAELASISINDVVYKPLTDSADLEKLRNLPIDSAIITAIDGFKISAIRGSISGINIGDVYISKIPAQSNFQNFLKYSKCSDKSVVYSRNIIAKCLRSTSTLGGNGYPQLLTFEQSSANTQCDMTCKNDLSKGITKWTGGACAAQVYEMSPICKGRNVIEIGGSKVMGKFGCTDVCTCFGKTLATLSIQDAALVCKAA